MIRVIGAAIFIVVGLLCSSATAAHGDDGLLAGVAKGASPTRRTIALNRLTIKPGDIIDIREIQGRKRLRASDLFREEGETKVQPRIIVIPPDDLDALDSNGQKRY